ncbi:cysteine--tRNA ligase [Eilatimonas milleporae]|uniref:Cysteine--tRNA ligase n=1 Tax=Eilatimonas milleporae TaxID=911205 RepID=A0A3M0CH45_9PROT|nr:cysteine--tRNA ligase [Eilatimonas milleporae]RMB08898.1 cysteinyl-tRNA synthetase [Eilatimonas milleporae]
MTGQPADRLVLWVHNTLTREKERFTPLDPANVRMYVCGPTVYDFAHIGNARPVVVFDILFRLLRRLYGADHVTYVRNITDIDDKIMDRAKRDGTSISDVTAHFTKAYSQDMGELGALPPSLTPKATDHLPQMIRMVEGLIAKGVAYAADGHVLFHVPAMESYGALSRHGRDELVAGARVEVAPYKRDAADFILWKPSDAGQPGWDSPWGRGRPGWHLECSAMIEEHLGDTIDIHGGGLDLIFPHHENEIAQSECCHGKPFVRTWMHNGYLTVDGEKMSKSLGNFHTVRDLCRQFPGEALRLSLMTAHYRQPIDFSLDHVAEQKRRLDRWYRLTDGVKPSEMVPPAVLQALCDDLNTPKALAAMDALATPDGADDLLAAGRFVGLLLQPATDWFQASSGRGAEGPTGDEIEALIAARKAARDARDYQEADRIRGVLADSNIILEDGPDGTTWRREG